MREIVVDTETTGLDPTRGDRLVEIGAVEIVNLSRTGNHFHCWINPERDMPDEAFAVHGLSAEFLAGHPVFAAHVERFLAFIAGAKLVIHNADFDMRFLNTELTAHGHPAIGAEWVIDTLALARQRHPGSPASLDALCQRYRIDNTRRVKHGALLDAELLAEVYAELRGGRQSSLLLQNLVDAPVTLLPPTARRRPHPLPPALTGAESLAHEAFVAALGTNALWRLYPEPTDVAAEVDRQLAAV